MTEENLSRRIRPTIGQVQFEVPFHDVDKMNVVWHGHYLKYFEYARTKLFQNLGLGGEVSGQFPYVWVVIESRIRHTAPLRFEDRVRVEARLVDVDYRVHVSYRVLNLTTGQRAAKGHTMLATLQKEGTMLLQTPDELLPYLTLPTVAVPDLGPSRLADFTAADCTTADSSEADFTIANSIAADFTTADLIPPDPPEKETTHD